MMIKVTGLALFLMTLFIPGQAYAEWHEASSDYFLVIADQNERGGMNNNFPLDCPPQPVVRSYQNEGPLETQNFKFVNWSEIVVAQGLTNK